MNKESFEKNLQKLKNDILYHKEKEIDKHELEYCDLILLTLDEITFENRKSKQGVLNYVLRDQPPFSDFNLASDLDFFVTYYLI